MKNELIMKNAAHCGSHQQTHFFTENILSLRSQVFGECELYSWQKNGVINGGIYMEKKLIKIH